MSGLAAQGQAYIYKLPAIVEHLPELRTSFGSFPDLTRVRNITGLAFGSTRDGLVAGFG